jgi:phage gp37-like protein
MSTPVPIITAVENAIVARLAKGLGRMVTSVETYGGEFDDEGLADVVRRFPAAWVTFGGIPRTVPVGTSRDRWKPEGTFIVMVGTRSVRSEAASRHGGPLATEIGTNLLIWGVRRLLTQQDLGLPIRELVPGAVKTLFNTRLQRDAFSVYALEFHTAWIESALEPGAFPQPVDPSTVDANDPTSGLDAIFATYAGQIDPAAHDLVSVRMNMHLDPTTTSGTPDEQAIATLQSPTQEP